MRLVVAAIDPTLRVACSMQLSDRGAAQAAFHPGTPLDVLFPQEPRRTEVHDSLEAVLSGEPRTIEFEAPRRSGAARVKVHLFPRFHAPESHRGFFVVAHDVSELDRSAARAEALRERLAAILDNAADAIVIADEQGRIEEVNASAERLFGWDRNDLEGQRLSTLMDGPYATTHQHHVERYLATGRSGILNIGPRPLPARHKDGRTLSIELSVGEAHIGGARKFIGVARDIAGRLEQQNDLREANATLAEKVAQLQQISEELEEQRRRSEELARSAEAARLAAERANAAKSRLLATVSHEVRTPLNGVLAVADLLSKMALPDSARELVDIIRRSGDDLMGLLNEVLDLSRLEAGALDIRPEPFSPRDLVDSLRAVWAVVANAKGLTLTVDGAVPPHRLLGDATRIRQVLANILNNAIKYTKSGGVKLLAQSEPTEYGKELLRFIVSDTGPGLDEQAAAHLFEPFSRGSAEYSRRETGTGLGLAISRELVEAMGGRIQAGNAHAGGAEVSVTLELAVAHDDPEDGGANAAAEASPRRPLRVLVAEDHDVNRRIVSLMLEALGCQYEVAVDGEEALAAATGGGFDVILMDVRMPRMDGLEAARAIRSGGGPSACLPIVAMTADAMAEDDPEIFDAGVTSVLTKPMTLPELASALDAALGATEAFGEPHDH